MGLHPELALVGVTTVCGNVPLADATENTLQVLDLINQSVIACERYHVDVETSGPLTVGRSIIDTHHRRGRTPNANVAFDADPRLSMSLLLESLSSQDLPLPSSPGYAFT